MNSVAKDGNPPTAQRRRAVVMGRTLPFILAGGVGFSVDASILTALTTLAGWQPLRARLVSFVGAVSVTWLINRHYAFTDRRAAQASSTASEYGRYVLTQSVGAVINLSVFALAIWWLPEWRAHPVLPLALGSACALVFNYYLMHCFVFPRRKPSPFEG